MNSIYIANLIYKSDFSRTTVDAFNAARSSKSTEVKGPRKFALRQRFNDNAVSRLNIVRCAGIVKFPVPMRASIHSKVNHSPIKYGALK